jgi:hypothetical protein
MHMSFLFRNTVIVLFLFTAELLAAQDSVAAKPILDVVFLKDGSKLSGNILKWDLARGMQFKLVTGAEVMIPKEEILKVQQDIPFATPAVEPPEYYHRGPRPYAFREEGLYNTFSVFLNFSESGGAGLHYSIGHRFSRMLGVGLGIGFESNDFFYTRNIVSILCLQDWVWLCTDRSGQWDN